MRIALITALSLLLAVQVQAAAPAQYADPFARDIRVMAKWFEGDFDNEEQLWFQDFPFSDVPAEKVVGRLHYRNTRLENSPLGDFVFLSERYVNHDPADGYQAWLVTFSSSKELNGILMRQAKLKSPSTFNSRLSESDLKKVARNTKAKFDAGCDVLWVRNAGQFEGRLLNDRCEDQGIYAESNQGAVVALSEKAYWKTRQLINADAAAEPAAPVTYELRKAKWFVCDMYFYSDNDTQVVEGLRIHSQGGTTKAVRESDGTVFEYLIREKAYPYYSVRPDFIYFSIRPEGDKISAVFSVNDIDSRMIGARTPDTGAFCHLDGYQFQEPLETL